MKKVLWFSWKSILHPEAGGAERLTHELRMEMQKNGYDVTHVTSSPGVKTSEIDGIKTISIGKSKFLHPIQALFYYLTQLRNHYDIVIEEVNTAPYLTNLFKGKEKHFLFYHQLAKKVWFYELKFPLSQIGYYIVEPFLTKLLSLRNPNVITVSESTKMDLIGYGYNKDKISIIREVAYAKGLNDLEDSLPKEKELTVVYLGSLRKMKRPIEVLKGFNELVKVIPEAKLWIAGGGDKKELEDYIKENNIPNVTFFGFIDEAKKEELLQKATVLSATSVKEGWGLIVAEAGIYGTPAVVYDVDGLRDAVKDSKTGYVVEDNDYISLAKKWHILWKDKNLYEKIRKEAFDFNKTLNIENSYEDLHRILNKE